MAFAVIGKGSLAASFNCAYIFTGELFPTVIRWVQRNPLPCAKTAGHGHIQAPPPTIPACQAGAPRAGRGTDLLAGRTVGSL